MTGDDTDIDASDQHRFDTPNADPPKRQDVLRSLADAGTAPTPLDISAPADCGELQNPVYEPILAEPSIVQAEDGTWYAYGAARPRVPDCGSAVSIPVVTSEDLVDWVSVGTAFDTPPAGVDVASMRAPAVTRYDGQYYLYYARGTADPAVALATSDRPYGPFEDRGVVVTGSDLGMANPTHPYVHVVDGTLHLLVGGAGSDPVTAVELRPDGTDRVTGTVKQLASDVYEAPSVYERGGRYYLFVSTGECCAGHDSTYAVEVGRADAITGPYTNQAGTDLRDVSCEHCGTAVLAGNGEFAGPGHATVFADGDGQDWCLYHAYDRTQPASVCGDVPRQSLLLDEVNWQAGWPTVADGTPTRLPGQSDGGGGGSDGQSPYGRTTGWPLPGRVQAEDFDAGGQGVSYNESTSGNAGGAYRQTDVDVESATEGGYNVGWIDAGEWWEYTVDVPESGTYDLDARVSSASGGGSFHVEVGGTDLTGSISVSATGGWQNWTTVSAGGVDLDAGEQVVRVVADDGGWNLNWFEFAARGSGADPPVADGTYRIEAVHSGNVLDITGTSTADGADVFQWTGADVAWQRWNLTYNDDGTYTIENAHSGKVLEIAGWSTAEGGNAQQWTDHGGDNQRFVVEADGDSYRIENANSGLVLEVADASTADGATVRQWTDAGGDHQRFRFVEV